MLPGATCSLFPAGAESKFVTLSVSRPLVTVAVTLGTAALMAAAKPDTVLLGAVGTATSILFTRKVLPAVRAGLAFSAVITPYTLL